MTTTTRVNRRSPGTTQRPAERLVDALVSDAHRLLGHLPEQELGPRAAEAVALLALIAGQDVEPVEGSDGTDGRWRIAQRVAPDRVISTVDPDARHVHKTVTRRQDGFKAHLAVEPDTGIITDCALTKATGGRQPRSSGRAGAAGGEDPAGDGVGRFCLRLRGFPRRTGRAWPCRPGQTGAGAAAIIPGGFTVDDFTVDHAARTATCPNGLTRPISPQRMGHFRHRLHRLPAAGPMHPQPQPARPSRSARTTRGNAPPVVPPVTRTGWPSTASTGRWSNAPSPG